MLFRIGIEICNAAEQQTLLVLAMFFSYLLCKRFSPRYAVFAALLVGVLLAGILGQLDFSRFRLELAVPEWTTPSFSLAATISIGIPLFIVAMASQNMPGIAVLRADGYQVPASPLISSTGIASILLAPFGSHGINLAAISAAICTGPRPTRTRTSAIPRRSGAASSTASQEPSAPPWQRCSRRSPRHWYCPSPPSPCSARS